MFKFGQAEPGASSQGGEELQQNGKSKKWKVMVENQIRIISKKGENLFGFIPGERDENAGIFCEQENSKENGGEEDVQTLDRAFTALSGSQKPNPGAQEQPEELL